MILAEKHTQDHQARGELKFQKRCWPDFKKNGSERFGDATFSKACDTFDAKLGNHARQMAEYLLEQDNAPDILLHLDNNPHELENLRSLPPQRQITELGRISNRLDSSTRVPSGPEPTWRKTGSDAAQVVEANWHRDGGDHIKDDRAWNEKLSTGICQKFRKVGAMVALATCTAGKR